MPTVGSLLIKLGLDSTAFVNGLDRSAKRLNKIGGGLKAVGSKLTTNVSVPLGLAAAAATKAAIDFESGFAGVRKTVDATEEEFSGLRTGLVQLTQEIPASAASVFQVAEAAGQLGVQKDNIVGFTKVMIDLGNTTNISAEEGAAALARLANVTGLPQTQFENLGSSLVDLGNNMETTENEILEMSLRLAGAAKTAGLSVADINGLAAALSSVGIRAEAGGTAFSKVILEMATSAADGAKGVEDFAAVAGVSAQQFADSFENDPARAIQMFIEGLGRVEEQGGNLFHTLEALGVKEVRLRDALLRTANAGGLVGKALDISNKAFKENTALVNEANERYKTTASKIEIFKNRIIALAAKVGDMLLPALNRLLDASAPILAWAGDLVTAFGDLDPGIQSIVIAFTTAFAAGGPILVVLGAFMSAITLISTPLLVGGAIVAGIIGGVTAIILNWKKIKKIPEIAERMVKGVEKWFVGKLNGIFDFVNKKINSVVSGFKGMWQAVVGGSFVPDMVNGIAMHFQRLDGVMVKPTVQATGKVQDAFRGTMEGVKMETQASVGFMSTMFQGFKFNALTVFQDIRRAAVNVWGSIQSQFVASLAGMIQGTATFANFMKNVWNTVLQAGLNTIISLATQYLISQFEQQKAQQSTLVAHQAVEATKTAATATGEAARAVMVAAASKLALGAAASSIAVIAAVGTTAIATMAVVTALTVAYLAAIGAALITTVVGAALGAAFEAAAAEVAIVGAAAAATAAKGLAVATAGAFKTVGGLVATPLASGGVATAPTLAMIGEGGEAEAVIPLSKLETMMGGGKEQTIVVELDGKVLSRAVVPQIPKMVRMKTGAML